MKDVTIISKVVGRKEGDRPVTGGGSQAAVDLSAYLLKKTWDTAWELREKDGVPYLFGKLPVVLQSGMTSYVADEAVDLPGIYDGLPIDNQTLKWVEVTDESGAVSRVLVAAGGGTGGGGGSVQYPLSWDGFSKGYWDGSEAKTIVIPSKLSDLENDVIVFKEDGWGDAFRIKPYFPGSGDDNYLAIERSVGGSGEEPFFNECLKIRGMTGKIEHVCTNGTAIEITHNSNNHWSNAFVLMNPIMPDGSNENLYVGKSWDSYNCGTIGYRYEGGGKWENYMTIGLSGADNILNVTGWRRVGINTSAPRHDLEVNGQMGVTNNMLLYGNGNGDIKSVYNNDGAITNMVGHKIAAIRHALKFHWGDESYEIGVIRGGGADARGFGVTHGNNKLVFLLGINYCDFWTFTNFRDKVSIEGLTEVQDAIFNKPITLKGDSNQSNIYSVWNDDDDVVIDNSYDDSKRIKHALKFDWWDDSYEIGTVRGGYIYATGFGVTYQKKHLVWKVNTTQMDVYEDLKVHGDIILQKGYDESGRSIFFGDGTNVYLNESPNNFLSIYADEGMKIYTQTSKYIELAGKGIKVNNGIITYNESGDYFELKGNLLVTGGITAFADSGSGNQWILDATDLSGVTSTNQYKVYSARVTKLLKDEVDEIDDKIADIKAAFNGLSSSSSASAIGSALKTLASKL